MHKNYNKFNLLSLLAILIAVFFLAFLYGNSEVTITFKDPGLEAAVRESIDKEVGPLTQKDVDTIQELNASNRQIENLDGIEHLIELRELDLEDNFIKSLTPLKATTKLEALNLRNNEITNLEEINFQDILYLNIRKLSLRHNVKRDEDGNGTRLSNISLLSQMAALRQLDLRDNHIEDLSPLSDLRRLTELDIRENKFKSIEPIETLTRLKKLNLRDNKTESLKPIRYLSRLTYLNIHSNPNLESLEPIQGLVNLETLIMRNVKVKDNYFLENLINLQQFNAIDTGLEETNPEEVIEKLRRKGALRGEVRPMRLLDTLDAPTFSHDSGFYKEAFSLELKNSDEEGEIYYTLDGSEPTMDSDTYEKPILIPKLGDNRATVIRAKTFSTNDTLSETITKTYLVDESIDERFDIPIFSLVTDPDNLFSEEAGIYENYDKRGYEWERPAHVEYLGPNGQLLISQNAGIRIHGGMTRGASQKSLRLYADSEYDKKSLFQYDFFENRDHKQFKHLLLRNSGNDWNQTMFNDALMHSLVQPLDTVDTQAYQPAVVYINGQYHGFQNIRERMDEYYLSDHYGINKDNLAILENNAVLYRGRNQDVYHYTNMIQYIKDNGVRDNKHLAYVKTKMDLENYIDYFASEIYFGNADWPGNNIKYWRKTTDTYEKDAPYGHDGRWRWMLYDTDFGFYRSDESWGNQEQPLNHQHNTIQWVMTEFDGVRGNRTWPNFLFRELMQNEQFKNQFLTRFNDLVNSYLSENVSASKIDELKNRINNEMPHQIERWGAIESMQAWQNYIDRKYIFAKERPEYIRNYIMEEFKIDRLVTIKISNETNQGYVRLNTLDINSDLPGNEMAEFWSGAYFKGIPITIEAIAKEGYEFSHWENLESSERQLQITPDQDIEIKAIFKKDKS